MKKYALMMVAILIATAAAPLIVDTVEQAVLGGKAKVSGNAVVGAQGGACCITPATPTVLLAGGCGFPGDYFVYQPVNTLPLDPRSADLITALAAASATNRLGPSPAFWLNTATNSTSVPAFTWDIAGYESDGGNYPLLPTFIVEGYTFGTPITVVGGGGTYLGTDAHVLVLNTDKCYLYETFDLQSSTAPYHNANGAIWDVTGGYEKLRYAIKLSDPKVDSAGLTSGDVAGFPITPFVLKHSEVFGSNPIIHGVRMTLTQSTEVGNGFVWPAAHGSSVNTTSQLFMGTTFRLQSTFDTVTCHNAGQSGLPYPAYMAKVFTMLQNYGLYLADFGNDGLISADSDQAWGDPGSTSSDVYDFAGWLHCIQLSNLEVVDNWPRIISKFSGQVKTTWVAP